MPAPQPGRARSAALMAQPPWQCRGDASVAMPP